MHDSPKFAVGDRVKVTQVDIDHLSDGDGDVECLCSTHEAKKHEGHSGEITFVRHRLSSDPALDIYFVRGAEPGFYADELEAVQ